MIPAYRQMQHMLGPAYSSQRQILPGCASRRRTWQSIRCRYGRCST
jgi:hypothetical protein